ncbi:MAG: primosomal protein N' [Anaerolineae bacterium UTCFX2]|nr:primosomal protein N' [Anaerolineales bacterium]OQY94229.1 MAG: primosomal protein N' [Anaerolineae bacterium UTCFX2]
MNSENRRAEDRPSFIEVAVNVPQVSGVFHYHLPDELKDQAQTGQLVLAPFGAQIVQGVILGSVEQPLVAQTRPILDLVDPEISLTPQQIALAKQMAADWLAPLAACIGLMLPPGVDQPADLIYTAQGHLPQGLSATQQRLLKLLYQRGPLRGRQIDHAMRRVHWRAAAQALIRRGLVHTERQTPAPTLRPKLRRTVELAVSPDEAQAALPDLGRPGAAALARRQAMLKYLIREKQAVDAAWLYAESGGSSADLRYLEERGLIRLGESQTWRDPLEKLTFADYAAPLLTSDQLRVWKAVQEHLDEAGSGKAVLPLLLHGVTGSGKTEIYLRAVQEVLDRGLQAIVLVPEIALTPQTIQRFAGRFAGRVGLVHSGLSDGERYDTWRRARLGELNLVVGPRSALFTPFTRLGLIVVDECHDDSYYQAEPAPRFNARQAAVSYAGLAGAVCLMGSATPDVVSIYQSQQGKLRLVELPARILAHRSAVQRQMELIRQRDGVEAQGRFRVLEGQAETIDLPPVSVVDMREELKAGNRSIFSQSLQGALAQALSQGEQAILFLNRRGSATYVFCRDCGYTLRCPRCEIPLTYHETEDSLLCHYCAYRRRMPQKCPECGGNRIRQYGTGTQKVESDLKALFPAMRVLRWDYETTRRKGAHAEILSRFSAHQADVLVGTQMLAKGMDLPLVTLVGVVLADVGLSLPDYRANERTFQVLTQVAGRAGRSPLGGEVILQTFQPEHYVIRIAAKHDIKAFYRQELEYRQRLGYPPFARLVRLEFRDFNSEKAEQAAQTMALQIREWIEEGGRRATRMIGPAPCFFSRMSGQYRWQIVLCGPDPASLISPRDLTGWRVEVDPPNLL